MRSPGRRWRVVLFLAGFGLLFLAWAGGQPPGAGPDEAAHLVKALGTASGQGLGAAPRFPAPPGNAFLAAYGRSYAVPDGFDFPIREPCYGGLPDQSAACLAVGDGTSTPAGFIDGGPPGRAVTYVAPYPPLPYLLPGALAWTGRSASSEFLLGRLGQAVSGLLLLGLAVRRSGAWDRTGLLLAMTPTAVFLLGTVNPSGVATVAAVATAATATRLVREPGPAGWAALGVAGSVLAVSRPEAPAFLVVLLAAAFALAGREGVRRAVRAAPRAAAGAVLALVSTTFLGLVWAATVMVFRAPRQAGVSTAAAVQSGVGYVPNMALGMVGRFGWLDVRPPLAVAVVWVVATAVLVAVGLVRGGRRHRLVLTGAAVGIPLLLLVEQGVLTPRGVHLQARYLLPLVAAVPVFAGSVVQERPPAARLTRPIVTGTALLAGLVQLLVLLVDGRRYAVGMAGPVLRWPFEAFWSPPGGWAPWLVAAVLGAAAVAASGLPGRAGAVPPVGATAGRRDDDARRGERALDEGVRDGVVRDGVTRDGVVRDGGTRGGATVSRR